MFETASFNIIHLLCSTIAPSKSVFKRDSALVDITFPPPKEERKDVAKVLKDLSREKEDNEQELGNT
ncbi:MAG: hypothetical protein JW904_10455 [Spirochaetales bacterium]|nr:hypothetical protein [Spirochaetales bacterium]